jgi:hypothetical protein
LSVEIRSRDAVERAFKALDVVPKKGGLRTATYELFAHCDNCGGINPNPPHSCGACGMVLLPRR